MGLEIKARAPHMLGVLVPLCCDQDSCHKQLRKDLFLLTVLEGSVHGHLLWQQEQVDHIFIHRQELERENRKWLIKSYECIMHFLLTDW